MNKEVYLQLLTYSLNGEFRALVTMRCGNETVVDYAGSWEGVEEFVKAMANAVYYMVTGMVNPRKYLGYDAELFFVPTPIHPGWIFHAKPTGGE